MLSAALDELKSVSGQDGRGPEPSASGIGIEIFSRLAILILTVAAAIASMAAIFAELATEPGVNRQPGQLILATATVVVSWAFIHSIFALHYAHEYYRPSGGPQGITEGLDFRGDRNPDYWAFFYFATSFGAASQTSDVSILTKPLRRLATLHAIISFFFNAAVLALTINLAASLM